MANRFILKHRRGTEQQWSTSNVIIYDGEIVVEKSEDGYTRLKVGDGTKKFSELPYMNMPGYALVTKKISIELPAANWDGTSSPYSQIVEIADITENSKIDLQVTPEQLTWLQDQEISLIAKNENGLSVVIYAIGEKPTIDFTVQSDFGAIQATISETTYK